MGQRITPENVADIACEGMWVSVFGEDGQARKGGRLYFSDPLVTIYRTNDYNLLLSPTDDEMWDDGDSKFALFAQ